VFIDEFDGIGTRRSYSQTAMETENTRIVTALLNELDGFTGNEGILVLAATNNRKALDEALIRPGRFDRKYLVPYPGKEERKKLIAMYTRNKNLAEDVEIEELAQLFDKCSCAKIETILNQAALFAERKGRRKIGRVEIVMAAAQVNE
jgi:cell division protease FtsH